MLIFKVLLQFELLLLRHGRFTQGSVVIHLRCGGIFSDSTITNVPLIQIVKYLKIGQYLMKLQYMKLRRTKSVQVFWGATLYI